MRYMRSGWLVFAVLFVAPGLLAQIRSADLEGVVIPKFQNTRPTFLKVGTGLLVPGGISLPSKLQVLYGASDLPPSRVFRALAFRRNLQYRRISTGTTLDAHLSLSASLTKPSGMHPTFALNRGPQVVSVFRGKLVVPYQRPRQTGWLEVKFQRPFVWPRGPRNSLCVEWDVFSSSRGKDRRAGWSEDVVEPDFGGPLPRSVTQQCFDPPTFLVIRVSRTMLPGRRLRVTIAGVPKNTNLVLAASRIGPPGGSWAGRRLPIRFPQAGCTNGLFELGVPLDFVWGARSDANGDAALLDYVLPPPGGYVIYLQIMWLNKNGLLRGPGVLGLTVGTGRRANVALRFAVAKKNPTTGVYLADRKTGQAPILRLR